MLKTLKHCLLSITFVSIVAQTPDDVKSSIKDVEFVDETLCADTDLVQNQTSKNKNEFNEQCKEFLIDVAQIELLEFLIFPIATITHELGHVIAAKALFDIPDPIQIHIGTKTPETASRLFSLGNLHFYKTIHWKRGSTELEEKYIKQGRKDYLGVMTAAGGLSATALMYILLSTITWYCDYCDNKKLSEITLKSLINGASPFYYISNTKNLSYKQKRFLINATLVICLSLISNIFYGCTPYCGGDGVKIWKECMGVTGVPLEIVHFFSILSAWGSLALLIKKYYDARKRLSPQDSKIALPAALISLIQPYKILIPEL